MAVIIPTLLPEAPAGAPTFATSTASDTIPVAPTGRYLVIAKNTTGSPNVVVFDDPTSGVGPAGAVTPMNPDLSHSVPATTGERHFLINAQRHRDVNGNVVVTNSAPAAGTTMLVYGPF